MAGAAGEIIENVTRKAEGSSVLISAAPRKTFAQIVLEARSHPSASMQVKPPAFTDQGEPAVYFSRDEVQASCSSIQFAVIAKCAYGRPAIPEIKQCLAQRLHLNSDFIISRLNVRHVLIRLGSEEDFIRVLLQKNLYIKGFLFRFFRWSHDFDFDADPATIPVWIGFPSIPVNFYQEEMLRSIAGNFGPVLRIHDATIAMTNTTEALVCVEMDLEMQRKERIWIGIENNGFWQSVNYHRVPHLCSKCHKIGHLEKDCKKSRNKQQPRRMTDNKANPETKRIIRKVQVSGNAVTNPGLSVENGNMFSILDKIQDSKMVDVADLTREYTNPASILECPEKKVFTSSSQDACINDQVEKAEESPNLKGQEVVPSELPSIYDGCDLKISGEISPQNVSQSQASNQLPPIHEECESMKGISEQHVSFDVGNCSDKQIMVIQSSEVISRLSESENINMFCGSTKPDNEVNLSLKSRDISILSGVLINDARLTRAKAKNVATHTSNLKK